MHCRLKALDATPPLDDAAWTSDRMRTASAGAAVNTVMTYAAQALSLITIPLYLTYLGEHQYGLMLLLVTLQSYLSQTNLGLNWAAMNMIGAARANRDQREFVVVVQNAVLLGLVTAIMALAASVVLAFASQYGMAELLKLDDGINPLAIVAVGCLAANSLAGGPVLLTFIGMGQASISCVYQGLGRLLSIPAMLYVARAGGGVAGVLFAHALILTLVLAAAIVHFLRLYPAVISNGWRLSRDQCWRQLTMGVKNLSAELGFLLHASAPMIALGATCGAAAVPLYAVPRALLDAAFTFGRANFSILQPAYAEAARHGRDAALKQMLAESIKRNVVLLGIFCAGFIVLCGPFISIWTQGQLDVPRATAIGVAAGAAAMFFIQLFQLFLVSINRQLEATWVLATTGVATMLVTVAAGWVFWFNGVVYAAAIASLATASVFGSRTISRLAASTVPREISWSTSVASVFGITLAAGLLVHDLILRAAAPSAAIVITGFGMMLCYALGITGFGIRRRF